MMTPERWQRIEALYHSALEREAEQRSAFLAEACAGDEELRREVERLLAQTGSLLDRPAWDAPDAAAAPLSRLGPYRIEGLLGAGGMGEVFRATDLRLHRAVAIKLLPRDRVADPERKRRFVQEARAASALNHPHIVTVYDIASEGEVDYLVMEYVAGTPLDRLIAGKPLPLEETIDYAIQVADALAAAHAAGIVHRDIKPGNLIVTPPREGGRPGTVKVLDFGLAKLQPRAGAEEATRTMEPPLTETGVAMGTLAYMSPEQARAEEVDGRTDLFSLGAVLYEMATGRRAFARLLDWTMPPLDGLPPELRPVAAKLLQADREWRYRDAAEVLSDLDRLRRKSKPAGLRTQSRWPFVAAAACAAGLALAGYFRLHGTPVLTDRDTIVLADFRNTTRDAVFDGALRQGLAVQLEQSPFLKLVSQERVQATLALMKQPPDARLDAKTARVVCERTGSAAVLEGSIDRLDGQYVLGLTATSCHTGDVLAAQQVKAKKEDVLDSLSRMTSILRAQLGESLAQVQQHSTPLPEATTASLEALKAYSTGQTLLFAKGSAAALPAFRHATELDPNFAMAHAFLGRVYGDIGEGALSSASLKRAWELREHTSDAERFFISANYDLQVTGNLTKAQETFQLWEQTYPRENHPPGLLSGEIYPFFGKHAQAVEEARKAIAMDPRFPFAYVTLATAYQFLDRFEDAEKTFQLADEHGVEVPEAMVQRYDLEFVKGNAAGMEQSVTRSRGMAGVEDWIAQHEGMVLAYGGRLREARTAARRASELARESGHGERAALFLAGAALWQALLGDRAGAQRDAAQALARSQDRDVTYGAALALALSGDGAEAERRAAELGKRFAEDSSVQIVYVPVLRAAGALHRRDGAGAVEALQAAAADDFGVPMCWFNGSFGTLYAPYLRGEAYLQMGRGAEAAAEFARIRDHRGLVGADPVGARALLEEARAWAVARDPAKARAAYERFFTLWKAADEDVPVLREARTEYARL